MGPMQAVKCSLPDDLRDKLREVAIARDISESSVIRQALRAYLEGKENGK